MKKNTLLFLLFVSISYSSFLFAQEKKIEKKLLGQELTIDNQRSIEETGFIRCGSTEYELALQAKNPNRATIEEFENWLAPKILKTKTDLASNNARVVQNIPVIFHVLTDGAGSENLTQAQIQAQLDQLNIDYANLDNSPFTAAADTEIQFCLAQQDPDGNNMNEAGINRVTDYGDTAQSQTTMNGGIKQATQWDPTKYMNIWVANLSGGLLGYAQFPDPTGSGISGLDPADVGPLEDADTDGVVVLYSSVGSEANPNSEGGVYASGRTLTHEVGHWLGLRHIWGDTSACTNDDYCADTPDATGSNFGCPTVDSCSSDGLGNDMVENYMDYSDDTCMNTFTADQKTRILAIMANAPRRVELTSSNACSPAIIYNLDGKLDIEDLNLVECGDSMAPDLTITNKGNTVLTSATIAYNLDSDTPVNYSWTGSLSYDQSETFTLPTIAVPDGSHTLNVELLSPNGGTDLQLSNNTDSSDSFTSYFDTTTINLELIPDDYGSETTWEFKDSSNTVLYSGGPYTDDDSTQIDVAFTVSLGECYTFTINDSWSDGICCDYGTGSYELLTDANVSIFAGGSFAAQENVTIGVNQLSVNEYTLNSIKIYPNPASNVLHISLANNDLPDTYKIYNMLGQVISQKAISAVSDLSVNTSSLSNGMYFIKITKEGNTVSLPFIKE